MLKVKVKVNKYAVREGDAFGSFCPEFCVASSGTTKAEALANLDEALDLYFEDIDPNELFETLTEDISEYLEIWGLTARQTEFEKSRQQALKAIAKALFDEAQATRNGSPNRSPVLKIDRELASAAV